MSAITRKLSHYFCPHIRKKKAKQRKNKKKIPPSSSDLFVTLWKAKNGSNHTKRVYKKNFIWLQNAVITLQKNIRQRRLLLRAIEWLCKQAAQSFLDCLQTILKAQWPIKNKPFILSLNDPFLPVILDVEPTENEYCISRKNRREKHFNNMFYYYILFV